MKTNICLANFGRGACVLTAVIGALLGTGCNRENPATSASAPAMTEIRGEPIQSPLPGSNTTSAASSDPAVTVASTTPDQPPTEPLATAASIETSPPPATQPEVAAKTGTPDEPLIVGFDRLAGFKYDVPEDQGTTNETTKASTTESQIPVEVRSLDKQFIALKGFMLPLKVESGLVTELLIMRDQSMCCFGAVPKINEWVSVKMVGKGVKPIMDQAVTLFGRLHVGEIRENGYLVGIYQIDGDRVAGPLDM